MSIYGRTQLLRVQIMMYIVEMQGDRRFLSRGEANRLTPNCTGQTRD